MSISVVEVNNSGDVFEIVVNPITDTSVVIAQAVDHAVVIVEPNGQQGPSLLFNDGLTQIGTNVILGGVTLIDKVIDMSVNNNTMWIKSKPLSDINDQNIIFTVGSLNSTAGWNCNPGILVSKNKRGADNIDLMLLTTGDTAESGFFFLNYGAEDGQYLPNLRVASNAEDGRSAAFNLDLAGRINDPGFTHFSVFYYDYDQYLLHGNQAPGIANSDLLNFTNGTGGALSASTVHFMWVDKDYNFMIGRNGWNDRPLGALHIGDNSATYAIYQKGASSTNWLAGNTRIGGTAAAVATRRLEIVAPVGKLAAIPYVIFQDSTSTEVGRINFNASSVFVGLNSGAADTNSGDNAGFGANALASATTGGGNAALGSGALQHVTTNRQNTGVGGNAGRFTNSRGNTFVGLGAGDLVDGGTIGDFNTITGAISGAIVTGGSIGSGNIIQGVFSYTGASILSNDNILFGNSQFSDSNITNSVYIVSNPNVNITLSNVVVLGDNRHNTILGATGTIVNSGDRLQIYGTTFVSTLAGVGTRMVVANAAGVLGVQAIPVSAVTSVTAANGTLTISPTTGAVLAGLNLANANTWTAKITVTLPTPSTNTIQDSFFATNTGVSTSGQQQWGGAYYSIGTSFSTTSKPLGVRWFNQTAGGASQANIMTWQSSLNGSGYVTTMVLVDVVSGGVVTGGAISIKNITTTGLLASQGQFTVNPNTTTQAGFQMAISTLLGTPQAGTIEHDGTHLYWTDVSNVRFQIDQQTTGVPSTRTITTTSPLSIGGTTGGTSDLSANRTIAWDFSVANTWTGLQTHLFTALGITNSNAILIQNTTVAAAASQQISPSLVMEGQGWKTNTTAGSQSVKFQQYVLPVQGAVSPTANWRLQSSIGGGAFADAISVTSDGQLQVGNFAPGTTFASSGASIITLGLVRAAGGFSVRTPAAGDNIITGMFAGGLGLQFTVSNTSGMFSIGSLAGGSTSGTGVQSNSVGFTNPANTTGEVVIHNFTYSIVHSTANSVNYSAISVTPTINQAGLGIGITRGIYVTPTLTNAVDYRGIEVVLNSLGVANSAAVKAITVRNSTAAAAGAQQASPSTLWEGQGWKTTATAASQSVIFGVYVLPVQGAANPTGTWNLFSNINGAGNTTLLSVSTTSLIFGMASPIINWGSGPLQFTLGANNLQITSSNIWGTGDSYIDINVANAAGYGGVEAVSRKLALGTFGANDIVFFPNRLEVARVISGVGISIGGGTAATSFFQIAAGTTAKSQINLTASVAPTSPVNGDIWFDGTNLFMRIAGVTKTFTII